MHQRWISYLIWRNAICQRCTEVCSVTEQTLMPTVDTQSVIRTPTLFQSIKQTTNLATSFLEWLCVCGPCRSTFSQYKSKLCKRLQGFGLWCHFKFQNDFWPGQLPIFKSVPISQSPSAPRNGANLGKLWNNHKTSYMLRSATFKYIDLCDLALKTNFGKLSQVCPVTEQTCKSSQQSSMSMWRLLCIEVCISPRWLHESLKNLGHSPCTKPSLASFCKHKLDL